jgi:hypothetical protein
MYQAAPMAGAAAAMSQQRTPVIRLADAFVNKNQALHVHYRQRGWMWLAPRRKPLLH